MIEKSETMAPKGLRVFVETIIGGGRIYEYEPTFWKPFYRNYEPLTLQRRVRFLLEWLKGYKVYYLEKEGTIVAYSVVSRGGGRYGFATNKDIVVGPYFVKEEHRGKRYSEILVSELLYNEKIEYEYAYDWIRYDNIPSIKCAERAGFFKTDTMDMKRPFRRLEVCSDHIGDYFLFKYKHP
jgi:L-amino acid N-acyltransferase YncA